MPLQQPLAYEDFLRIAQQSGLDTSAAHLAELFPYVQGVLSSLEPLQGLDVSQVEPDMAFLPDPEQTGSR
jgi:Asp-tRNA(Asn)/Glu-tRNA(Gln) amidotransferase C subunit